MLRIKSDSRVPFGASPLGRSPRIERAWPTSQDGQTTAVDQATAWEPAPTLALFHQVSHVWVHSTLRPEVLVALLAAAAVIVAAPFNCDAAWYMVAARRMLHGDRLFVNLMDTNPPLIVWLTAIPAFLSTSLNVSDRI